MSTHCLFMLLVLLSYIQCTQTVKCYSCNSAIEEECEEFDEDDFGKFEVDCTDADQLPKGELLDDLKDAVGCRKMKQEVGDEERTIRECAYTGDDVDGLKRTGNKGVRMFYYQCSDEDLCNGAAGQTQALLAVLLSLAVALLRQ